MKGEQNEQANAGVCACNACQRLPRRFGHIHWKGFGCQWQEPCCVNASPRMLACRLHFGPFGWRWPAVAISINGGFTDSFVFPDPKCPRCSHEESWPRCGEKLGEAGVVAVAFGKVARRWQRASGWAAGDLDHSTGRFAIDSYRASERIQDKMVVLRMGGASGQWNIAA